MLFSFAWCLPVQALPHDEDRVKAAVILQLARFVEWPPVAIAAAPTLNICLAGKSTWFEALAQASRGQTVNGKPVQVLPVKTHVDAEACHVLVLGSSLKESVRLQFEDLPALTVSDEPRFASQGGMVQIIVEGGRVGFELSPSAARRKGIRFSSKLIRLAKIVEDSD
ncbi:MAG: YfiR family protein [Bryobacterales bacterium]|nr:YfiR family protein [Bryobacterales bacterium]